MFYDKLMLASIQHVAGRIAHTHTGLQYKTTYISINKCYIMAERTISCLFYESL